jgi:hypothetical protein
VGLQHQVAAPQTAVPKVHTRETGATSRRATLDLAALSSVATGRTTGVDVKSRIVSIVCPRCAQFADVHVLRRSTSGGPRSRELLELQCPAGCALSDADGQQLRASGVLR